MWSLDNATVAETVEGFSHRNLLKYRAGVPHFYYTRYNETQHSYLVSFGSTVSAQNTPRSTMHDKCMQSDLTRRKALYSDRRHAGCAPRPYNLEDCDGRRRAWAVKT